MKRRATESKDNSGDITKKDISRVVNESVIESTQDNKFVGITKDLFNLDKDIKEFESKSKTKYRGANKFLENL